MNTKKKSDIKKRTSMTFSEQLKLSLQLKQETNKNQRFLASKFSISVGMVNKLINMNNESLVSENLLHRKRHVKLRKTEDLEPVLFTWFNESRSRNMSVTSEILIEKALYIAEQLGIQDFKASNGWLESFIKRNGIKSMKINGEASLVDPTILTDFRDILKQKLSEYEDKNVFNCDESGLMFKQSSRRTYTLSEADKANGVFSKERITILFAVSKAGEKLKPLIIGKSKNPRCFKNIKIENLPVYYFSQFKSWMNSSIFIEWIKKIDKEMLKNNRKILLMLDNAPVHPKEIELTNIELLFLPANTTSKIQPLDQGIIKAFKDGYRKTLLSEILFRMEVEKEFNFEHYCKKITVYDAILWTGRAWSALTEETVKNCFNKGIENCYNPTEIKIKTVVCSNIIVEADEENEELPTYCVHSSDDKELIASIIENSKSEKKFIELTTDDEDTKESELHKISSDYTLLEAFIAVEKLEKYFIQHLPEKINAVWKLKEELVSSKKTRTPLITDWLVHKCIN